MLNSRCLAFVFLFFSSLFFYSQNVPVQFQGTVSDERGNLPSAQIQISRAAMSKIQFSRMAMVNTTFPFLLAAIFWLQ